MDLGSSSGGQGVSLQMLRQKEVKSVLNKLKKRDGWFLVDYTLNPFEGCSCNCQYCYVRGSKYGENMDEGLVVKVNAPELLDKQLSLRARKNQYGFVVVGSATDAYIHHESEWKITRRFLESLLKHQFPVFISTKTNLIRRDIDLLKEIDKQARLPEDLKDSINRGLILSVSLSTLDERISSTLEPGALLPGKRLELVNYLKNEGFLVGVNAIPVLPFISDTEEELDKIIEATKNSGADYILVGGLTLFGEGPADSKTLYFKFLERQFPELISKYQHLYQFGYSTQGDYQKKLKERADRLCSKYGIRNSIISNGV